MMRTYRGVVCEKNKKYMVFLTEKGEFLRGVPIGDPPEVGEEADFRLVATSLIGGSKAKPRFAGAVLVAAAVLFFIISSLSPLNEKVMAYIQLEAETAMELGVNRNGNVITLRYLNETPIEPDRLSAWVGHPILAVLDMAVMELSVNAKQISVTTIYPNQKDKQETRERIGKAVQEIRSKHEELDMEIVESTPEERTVANKKKMSIHQFKSTKNDGSLNEKQPVNNTNQVEEKPEQDHGQKPKKDTVPPPMEPKQKNEETERLNKSNEQQGPPAKKIEKQPNENRSENVPPHADKKGSPSSPPGLSKQGDGNRGKPHKQEKEKEKEKQKEKQKEKEKPDNEKKAGSGSPS